MSRTYRIVGSEMRLKNTEVLFLDLKIALDSLGLVESQASSCDFLIFVNYERKAWHEFKKFKNDKTRLILIRFEPIAVLPIQYTKKIENRFNLVITPGGRVNTGLSAKFIGWPYKYDPNPSQPQPGVLDLKHVIRDAISSNLFEYDYWKFRRNELVLIAANKVSPTSNSNYGLRRKLAKSLTVDELHVYGALWVAPLKVKLCHRFRVMAYAIRTGYFPNMKAIYGNLFAKYDNVINEPSNKHEITKAYKYSLVIENSSEYCSEKLFDAIISGSIPIYVGANNYEIDLPEDLYLNCNGSVQDIRNILGSITESQNKEMLLRIKQFVLSNHFINTWKSEKVYEKIAVAIKDQN